MYQVNLLPWRTQRVATRYRFWIRVLLLQLGVLLLCLMLLSSYLSLLQRQQQQQIALLKTDEDSLTLRYQQTQQAIVHLAQLQLLQQQRWQREWHNQAYLRLLQQLPQQMPETLWLTSLEEHNGTMLLKGVSSDYPSLARFVSALNNIKTLQQIQLSQMNINATGQHQFILQSHWQPDGVARDGQIFNDE